MPAPTPEERRERITRQLRRRRALRRVVLGAVVLLFTTIVLDQVRAIRAGRADDWARFERMPMRVEQVPAGDLLVVRHPGGDAQTVRLVGVDAPDPDAPGGAMYWSAESRDHLASRVLGRDVLLRLEPTQTRDATDGALLAHVYLGEDDHLNAALVRAGHAYADRRIAHTMLRQFETDEVAARSRKLGLWKQVRDDEQPAWRQAWLRELRERPARERRPSSRPS